MPFTLKLRIPGWLRRGSVSVNGKWTDLSRKDAGKYLDVRVERIAGTVVELDLDMTPRLTIAHTKVEEDLNQVAVERGPLLYCLESVDTDARDLGRVMLPVSAKFTEAQTEILGCQLVSLETTGYTFEQNVWYDGDALYQTLELPELRPVRIRMIPYFAWDNRGMGQMTVWLPALWGRL